ncbi:polyphosphate kinase 2 [Methyloferula stellata]|uniref:polyphosphate kinase 2 n=1 Tax=Methyloferula stellata TaxID=876270 RepID=UPI0003694F84|nr:polyphosphate kinase 2 [Methyloferula stellata]
MGQKQKTADTPDHLDKHNYESELYELQVELVKLQKHIIQNNEKIVVLFEGRDAAGKDGTIKRIIEHLSPREVRVIALGKPSDREVTSWYFQRYARYLPAAQEMTLFNRSWYNRAGVERVMGFCTKAETEAFLEDAPIFESLLIHAGIKLLKYYLDISKDEQKKRLKDRTQNPLTQWKISPIDQAAQKEWDDYSEARNIMLARTSTPTAPWHIVRADDKHKARLNVIRDLLFNLEYKDKPNKAEAPDPAIVFSYTPDALRDGRIAP